MLGEMIECSICFTIIVEPIRIKCSHLFCLDCIEKLVTNNDDPKCPMDRLSFNFEDDIKYDDQVLLQNFLHYPNECKQKIETILHWRKSRKSLKEFRVAYGNLHEYLSGENNNKHRWTAYADILKCDDKKTAILNDFKYKSNLFALADLEAEKKLLEESNYDIDIDTTQVIDKVTFKLHPTFSPCNVYVQDAPFEIVRYGWGAFNITIVIEFHEYLNIPSLELEHFLEFDKDKSENYKQIYVDVDKILANK
jgi:transcription initiation factor IIF auxiliary subunit